MKRGGIREVGKCVADGEVKYQNFVYNKDYTKIINRKDDGVDELSFLASSVISRRGKCVVAKDWEHLLEGRDFIIASNKFIHDYSTQCLILLRDLRINDYKKVTGIIINI